jgi:hypothetical protein
MISNEPVFVREQFEQPCRECQPNRTKFVAFHTNGEMPSHLRDFTEKIVTQECLSMIPLKGK